MTGYAEAIDARAKLGAQAEELSLRSGELARVSRELEPVEKTYREFVDDFEIGLWKRHEDEEGFKLPPAAMRVKLAHKAMDPALLGRYVGLSHSRGRLVQRIRDLKVEIEAQRSTIQALSDYCLARTVGRTSSPSSSLASRHRRASLRRSGAPSTRRSMSPGASPGSPR